MTETNIISQPHVETKEYLETDNGIFQLQSIAGDKFRLLPKGMYTPREDKSALYRTELVKTVVDGLERTHKDPNRPGVYVQGPEGVGKSFLLYTVTQIAKFELDWITVYIPNCRQWVRSLSPTQAKGFFLDRVLDAFSVRHLQEKFPNFYSSLRKPPKQRESWEVIDAVRRGYRKLRGLQHQEEENEGKKDWFLAAGIDADKVSAMYSKACSFLEGRHESPVLIVFDEVNALWPEGLPAVIHSEPWSLAAFGAPTLGHGALLVSGTTDCEFIDQGIPAGANEILVSVGPLDLDERNTLLKTPEFEVLRDLKIVNKELWQNVIDASGNIPGELKKFCLRLKNEIKATKRERSADDSADEEPPSKKLRSVIDDTRSRNRADQKAKLDKALQRDSSGVFKGRLSDSCRSVFIYGTPARVDRTTLRVPNWVISKDGGSMHPATFDVQTVYFKWFQKSGEDKDSDHDKLLEAISTVSSDK